MSTYNVYCDETKPLSALEIAIAFEKDPDHEMFKLYYVKCKKCGAFINNKRYDQHNTERGCYNEQVYRKRNGNAQNAITKSMLFTMGGRNMYDNWKFGSLDIYAHLTFYERVK